MKIELVLLLYDELIGGKTVSRTQFCAEHAIVERTFYRYLREITFFCARINRRILWMFPSGKAYTALRKSEVRELLTSVWQRFSRFQKNAIIVNK